MPWGAQHPWERAAAADSPVCSTHCTPAPAGEAAEAQEPLAALQGLPEAEALASAAGPEREQALSLPRDATADVWLRDGALQRGWAGVCGEQAALP